MYSGFIHSRTLSTTCRSDGPAAQTVYLNTRAYNVVTDRLRTCAARNDMHRRAQQQRTSAYITHTTGTFCYRVWNTRRRRGGNRISRAISDFLRSIETSGCPRGAAVCIPVCATTRIPNNSYNSYSSVRISHYYRYASAPFARGSIVAVGSGTQPRGPRRIRLLRNIASVMRPLNRLSGPRPSIDWKKISNTCPQECRAKAYRGVIVRTTRPQHWVTQVSAHFSLALRYRIARCSSSPGYFFASGSRCLHNFLNVPDSKSSTYRVPRSNATFSSSTRILPSARPKCNALDVPYVVSSSAINHAMHTTMHSVFDLISGEISR